MKRIVIILPMLIALLTSCTQDDIYNPTNGEGITLRIVPDALPVIETRTATPQMAEADYKVDQVIILAFSQANGTLRARYSQEISYPENSVTMMLPSDEDLDLRAVCNLTDEQLGEIVSLQDLENKILTIAREDDVFKGHLVMTNDLTPLIIKKEELADKSKSYTVKVKRMAAKICFDIKFDPENSADDFQLTDITAYNLPKKSYLVPRQGNNTSIYEPNDGDAANLTAGMQKEDNYFTNGDRLTYDVMKDDATGKDFYTTDFYQFENRRGAKTDDDEIYNDFKDRSELRQALKGYIGDNDYPMGSYVIIKGMYNSGGKDGTYYDAAYKVYLGANNYSDFNINRNTLYKYTVYIKSCDRIDTRVDSEIINDPKITPTFDMPLDAHCNSVKCSLFAPDGEYEIFVKDPELTPWLEISSSPTYRPHIAGQPMTDDCAGTRMKMTGPKIGEMYIHTDEYLPHMNRSEAENDASEISNDTRTGYIVMQKRDANGTVVSETTLAVTQRPAQVVTLQIKNLLTGSIHLHRYYIENYLEKKNLPYGFERCMDPMLMINNTAGFDTKYDGLETTRYLYQAGLDPKQKLVVGQKPYYNPEMKDWLTDPTLKIPEDTAVGYAIAHNRDRDGNGRIDKDEVLWYLPTCMEMYQLGRVLQDRNLWYENAGDKFWTSNTVCAGSSVADGYSYYVDTSKKYDHQEFDQARVYKSAKRGLRYNVLCCRRAEDETLGGDNFDGRIDGTIIINGDWGDDNGDIMPKKSRK